MKRSIAIVVALALLPACKDERQAPAARVDDYAAELGTSAASASASASAGGAKSVEESNDVWDFSYSYPAAAGRIPALRAMLDARQVKALADLKAEAIDARADADANGYPFNPHLLAVAWQVVTDLPDWLSLSTEVDTYEGGAHPNHGFDALLWDKRGNKPVEPASLFASQAALDAAVRTPFCSALNKQREEKRQEPIPEPTGPDDWMNVCPKIGDTTVILGSSNSRTFDRVGFLIDPYTAGPYAEGSYEVTLPVTAAVKAAVKPAYAASFTVTR